MSDGKCGTHTYPNIDQKKIDAILAALRQSGSTVTGQNPWDVDTHNHGVKLRGSWNQATSTLSIIVTDKNWYVPCSKIWDTIDPLIRHVQQLAAAEVPDGNEAQAATASPEAASAGLAAANDGKCGTHTYPNVDQRKINAILAALRQSGSTVTGQNPWDVDTHNNGVKLRGSWNQATSTLSIIVTDKNWYVPCGKIWDTIDPLIRHVQGVAESEVVL